MANTITISITYDRTKARALKHYLDKKGSSLQLEVTKHIDGMFEKNVPSAVKEYLDCDTDSDGDDNQQ